MTSSLKSTITESSLNNKMTVDKPYLDNLMGNVAGKEAKILYSKSKVYLHPTPSVKDNIPGYFALLQRDISQSSELESLDSVSTSRTSSASYLLAWIPESSLGGIINEYKQVESLETDSSAIKSPIVPLPPVIDHPNSIGNSGFAIPITSIFSLFFRLPCTGWWFGSLIINSRAGDPFPALFFHDSECESTILQKKMYARKNFDICGASEAIFWGGDQVLTWLRRHIVVQRCEVERNTYLIQPSEEDHNAFGKEPLTSAYSRPIQQSRMVNVIRSEGSQNKNLRNTSMDPLTKFVKEKSWNLMEKFSQVTTFARRTADSVVENHNLPPQVRRLLRNPEVQTLQEEFDSARIYLARWAMGVAEQSEREINQRNKTARRVLEIEKTGVGDFELLNAEMGVLNVQEKRKAVSLSEWKRFFDEKSGTLTYTVDEVKERIFHGGLDPEDGVRKESWLFLLGVYKWNSTAKERQQEMSRLRDEYVKLKGAWWSRFADQDDESKELEWWREQRSRIEKDVHRTDRTVQLFAGEDTPHPNPSSPFAEVGTNIHLEQLKDLLLTYNEYNRELGYVQGMSDLLAPIYAVMQDDAFAFWAFKNFMHRMERNFLRDQSGMRKQLLTLENLVQLMDPKLYLHLQSADCVNFFFFFRMLLVWFKREFDWDSVLSLWERLWTDFLTSNFHIFIALAILEKHRDVIMDHLKHFDEVLKYVNELSATIELETTLIHAEALFYRFQRIVEATDKKSNFPSPNLRQRKTKTSSQGKIAMSTSSSNDASTKFADNGTTSHCLPGYMGVEGESKDTNNHVPDFIRPELRQLLSREVETISKN